MTYALLIGQRSYSSWSLRGWLPFAAFDIPVAVESAVIYGEDFHETVQAFGGHRTVPVLRRSDGALLTDSMAIAWHLAEAFPDKRMLPSHPVWRAMAQSLIAEMHSGFTALRAACPMNLRTAWTGFAPSDAVLADLRRLEAVWSHALDLSGGPFLFGAYGLADVFYAPVATRIATYDLPVSDTARAYVSAHLHHLPLRRWRTMGATEGPDLTQYEMPLGRAPYPAPPAIPARAVEAGPPENTHCPYSGGPVTNFAEIGGRVFGFGSALCRDETVLDAEAWPAFMEIYDS
jgi:glutathione S-transferase